MIGYPNLDKEKVMEEKGVKELMEALEGLKILLEAGLKVSKDFSVSKLVSEGAALALRFGDLKDAVVGLKEVAGEVKDLDHDEVVQIVSKVYELVELVKVRLA